ncbi:MULTISPECIES: type I glutamate--ammonia ligase [Acetobacter]|jgi:glutamine synthetase|uniref:Glutamine synthetase n=1 Tax=Acetobacter peroxydans TaxID=104098 RepID=A0A4Y3TPW7_9PROT|nr:type I glutamate--ammonia ligase [Acetobacter peroxydans]MCH4144316.1 type I glutamate--ammonia ligase [Acetobacter peroxydans]MCI1393893.1 type I glutamate--ammonia ligase [Acetobacter peroxydans]MCI1410447.1 type I glutamate--ammonia ligase [Acetobacter peroxydans]MCI1439885.1 type I glutamate--ammonia ligase [Acetobacter peroxydans]MCI1565652.1 type I glutamate--ammonia ligase [Acetobacter peroxydans]
MVKKTASAGDSKAAAIAKVFDLIQEHAIELVDLRFTDTHGKWQHTCQHVSTIEEDSFTDGFMFDGSSIAGWKAINESDMVLLPDATSAVVDPFSARPQLILFCDIIEPSTGQPYNRDPRSTAKLAEQYLKSSGLGDTAFFGPEAEFFVFDNVQFGTGPNYGKYQLDSIEGPGASLKDFPEGNMGHRPGVKGGYFPVAPVDSESDLRAEMLATMGEMGLAIEKHHHEVAQSQHELGTKFETLVRAADFMQIYKYCVHNVAHSYGKTATFMPKPIFGDNGSGMHVHQSIWKDGKPTFAGNGYADLSDTALYYIGGIIKHAKALNAFTNPSTNSYKRLIPGFEAPVLLAYSARNRSASCRIPYATSPKAKRVEVRFPDPTANPYLAFSAMLMAGLDGIKNKIHPGDAMDKDLYDLPPEELKQIPTVCGSLREALEALAADHDFLLAGGVFTKDQIESYIGLKWQDVYRFEHTPHPVEFEMYYSV